jgi:hypothetical protein
MVSLVCYVNLVILVMSRKEEDWMVECAGW